LLSRGTCLEIDGNERKNNSEEIADIMASFGDESQGVSAQAKNECGDDVSKGQYHGELQDALHLAVRSGDHVHILSVVRVEAGFNLLFRRNYEKPRFYRATIEVLPDAADHGCTGSAPNYAVIMRHNLQISQFAQAAEE
jgi:hypothetical protein